MLRAMPPEQDEAPADHSAAGEENDVDSGLVEVLVTRGHEERPEARADGAAEHHEAHVAVRRHAEPPARTKLDAGGHRTGPIEAKRPDDVAGHELVIVRKGPWDAPPSRAVIARCACRAWGNAWAREEFAQARALDYHWERILEGVRLEHAQHVHALRERDARRPDRGFYG